MKEEIGNEFGIKTEKITNYSYKIPKAGKMLVPTIIFASEKLMEKIKLDKSLEQAKNMAALSGIQKHALVMPDAHQGYGFPIGGVAAFDLNSGIISPGGVGYDINCLHGNTKILTEHGFNLKIADFQQNINQSDSMMQFSFSLPTLGAKKIENKKILAYMYKEDQVFELETASGLKIRATKDHPFLTKKGMKELKELSADEVIAIFPFTGVEYEIPSDYVIIDEYSARFTREQLVELKKRDLLPLKESSSKLPYLAKILGYLYGDGLVYFYKNKGYVNFYGAKEDLEIIKEDLKRIGFSSQIYSRKRKHRINTQYRMVNFETETYELHCPSKALANLLIALGMPLGTKAITKYSVPKWVMRSKNWIKRLFLAGFFGAELSSPRTGSKTGFNMPVLSQNKAKVLEDSGRTFLIQIMKLLEDLGVKVSKITSRAGINNKYGEVVRLRLNISGEEENLLRLWKTIGFEYNLKRKNLANIASFYILLKKAENAKRRDLANKIKEYKNKGLKLKEIQKLLFGKINSRFIERHYYEDVGQRINLDFISFADFKKKCLEDLAEYGVIFDKIIKISAKGVERVYDFTMRDNHNFIADSFIVSNCGVRMLTTGLKTEEIRKRRKAILDEIYRNVPVGLGKGGKTILEKDELLEVLDKGSEWAIKNGYGTKKDLERHEEYGRIKAADSSLVSEVALKRGRPQIGSLGAGNHFIEISEVSELFDEKTAKVFGVEKGDAVLMIHCGSRGLGHQVASDYIKKMEDEYGHEHLPDRELINAPFNSDLGQEYFKAMSASANYAWANRQMIMHWTRESFSKVFGKTKMDLIYDVAHNIAKVEKHKIDGRTKEVCMHRKGATRSFGPGRDEIPSIYRKVGQPVIIPGSMGTASYLLVGTKKAEEVSFGSTAHGAGRVMSRHAALKQYRGEAVRAALEKQDIVLKSTSWKGVAEEAPGVYKDIDEVVRVSHEAGIGNLVAKVKPLAVIKG